MKKNILFTTLLMALAFANVQAQTSKVGQVTKPEDEEIVHINSLSLKVNTMTSDQAETIDRYINGQKARGFWLSIGQAALSSLAGSGSAIIINEIMKVAQIRKNKKEAWETMIGNECLYVDSLSYVSDLTDFYSEGSYHGALDPADLNFNGFTLNAQRDGNDVLLFYSHVDISEDALNEIFNHSKFRLVIDSMYFYPYRCHLPNWSANSIFPEKGKDYGRCTHFSFDERDNLTVNLDFTITSSWYNEAIILAKDVELGTFSVQVPIEKSKLTDSVFVYKTGRKDMDSLTMAGECFIVPRSFMPLPGGKARWGTGEYNVRVTVSERCTLTPKMQENWEKDLRCLRRMKKENKVKDYFINVYKQNGNTVVRDLLEKVSKTARDEMGLK